MTEKTNDVERRDEPRARGGNLEVIATDIKYIQKDILEIKGKLDKDFVSQDQFQPVRNLVYGLVGLIMVAVIGALMALVIK